MNLTQEIKSILTKPATCDATPTEVVKILRETHGPDAFRESTAKVTASKLRSQMRKQQQVDDAETVRANGKADAKKLFKQTATATNEELYDDNMEECLLEEGHDDVVAAFAAYEQLLSEQKAKVATLEACVTQFESILEDWKSQQ